MPPHHRCFTDSTSPRRSTSTAPDLLQPMGSAISSRPQGLEPGAPPAAGKDSGSAVEGKGKGKVVDREQEGRSEHARLNAGKTQLLEGTELDRRAWEPMGGQEQHLWTTPASTSTQARPPSPLEALSQLAPPTLDLGGTLPDADRRDSAAGRALGVDSSTPAGHFRSLPSLPIDVDSPLYSMPMAHTDSPSHRRPRRPLPSPSPPLRPSPIATHRPPSTTAPSPPSHSAHPSQLASPFVLSIPPGPLAYPLLHQTSAPGVSSRARATSLTVSGSGSASSMASPSRSQRYADPDHHWLSENDVAGLTEETGPWGRRRVLTRRAGGAESDSEHRRSEFGDDDDDDDDTSSGSKQGGLATFGSTTHSQHPIHQRPSPLLPASPPLNRASTPSPAEPPLPALVPALLSLLTCRACHRLLRDPTTLACGHSVCLACSLSSLRPSLDLPHDRPALSLESQFARNPSTPVAAVSMTRSPSGGLLANLLGIGAPSAPTPRPGMAPRSTSIGYRVKAVCPYPACTHKDRGATLGEPQTDYVLQKVLSMLRRDLPDLEAGVNRAEWDGERPGLVETRGESSDASSPSSAGGGDDPIGEEENKRAHRSKEWESSKRVRREAGEEEDGLRGIDLDLDDVPATFVAELQSELECQVCVQLFHDPITTPCGHTFCQKCLARSLDHSDKCPLCRSDFPSFTYFQSQPSTSTTTSLISTAFPLLSVERKASIEAEQRSNTLDTPIFVCTLAWPNLPTYIHIFEPRYRLMMRRVMDGERQFGMVLPSRHDGGVSEYGTMLQVQSCNMIEDGRSIVETIGTYRFRVLEKGTFDGYTVGRIERVDDISSEQEAELEAAALARNPPEAEMRRRRVPTSPPPGAPGQGQPPAEQAIELSTAQLMNVCLEFVQTLRSGSAPWVLQRLNNTIGPMPTNASDFSFWMAEVMPVDDHVKAALLQITSPRERLRLLVFWIEQFRSSWWFSRGCSIM